MDSPSDTTNVFDRNFLRNADDLKDLYIAALKGGLTKQSRDNFGAVSASVVRRKAKPQVPGLNTPLLPDDRRTLKSLAVKGYTFIPDIFSADDIAEIKRFTHDKIVDVSAYERHESMPFSQVPDDVNFAHFDFKAFGACAPIYRVVHDERLIRIVTNYLEAPPTIGIVSLWWSYPRPGAPEGMQMFHHDRGDFRSCNLFAYLTDVDLGTGPHGYVERTHETKVLAPIVQQRFGSQPQIYNEFWQWMEKHRKTDEEVQRYFTPDEIKFHTGPQGTSFLEDTRGLHKGTRPTTGPRLAFEIFYGVMPKFNESIEPLVRETLDLPPELKVPTDQLSPLVRYATRQFYL